MEIKEAICKAAYIAARFELKAKEFDNISPPNPKAMCTAKKYREEADALLTLVKVAEAFSQEGKE